MPIACVINEQIICMHGGLSPRLHTVADIAALQKPLVTGNKLNLHIDILWSDPHFDAWGFGVSSCVPRGFLVHHKCKVE